VRVCHADTALPSIELLDAVDLNAYAMLVAKQSPRRAGTRVPYVGEQSYWTVLGVDGATHCPR